MPVSYRKLSNKWYIRFTKGSGKSRKEKSKSFPGSLHEKTIRAKAQWFEEEWALGRFDPFEKNSAGTIPISDAVEEYCQQNLDNGNWGDVTHKTVRPEILRIIDPKAEYLLGPDTDKEFFEDLLQSSNGNANTKKGNKGRINTFITWAHESGYLPNDFSIDITNHEKIELRNSDSVKYLTWQQLRDICDAHRFIFRQNRLIFGSTSTKPSGFYTDMWWFYFYSLLRDQELPKLRVKDLMPGGRLRVHGKGRRTDIIYLPPPALTIAEKYAFGKDPEEHLFVSNTSSIKEHLGNAVTMAMGEKFASIHGHRGLHQLRHGGIVHYLSLGKAIQFVSKLARHRTISITDQTYGDIIGQAVRDVFSDITHRPATNERLRGKSLTGMN